jgi:hypothetical protein
LSAAKSGAAISASDPHFASLNAGYLLEGAMRIRDQAGAA